MEAILPEYRLSIMPETELTERTIPDTVISFSKTAAIYTTIYGRTHPRATVNKKEVKIKNTATLFDWRISLSAIIDIPVYSLFCVRLSVIKTIKKSGALIQRKNHSEEGASCLVIWIRRRMRYVFGFILSVHGRFSH